MRIKGMNKCEVCVIDLPIGCPQHRWAAIILIHILQVGQSPQRPWWLLQVTCHSPGWGIISCRNFSVRFQTTMKYTMCLFSCWILHRNDHEIAIMCDPRSEGRDWNNFLLKGEADLIHNQNNTTIRPSNPTTGHIPWENHNSKRVMYQNVHCSSIYNSQDMEAT